MSTENEAAPPPHQPYVPIRRSCRNSPGPRCWLEQSSASSSGRRRSLLLKVGMTVSASVPIAVYHHAVSCVQTFGVGGPRYEKLCRRRLPRANRSRSASVLRCAFARLRDELGTCDDCVGSRWLAGCAANDSRCARAFIVKQHGKLKYRKAPRVRKCWSRRKGGSSAYGLYRLRHRTRANFSQGAKALAGRAEHNLTRSRDRRKVGLRATIGANCLRDARRRLPDRPASRA